MQNQLLINGELVTGEGEKQAVYNPATGEVLKRRQHRWTLPSRLPIARSQSGDKRRRKRAPNVC